MEFIDIFKEILQKYDNNQSALARAIGVKQSQISEWLKGKCKPSYDVLRSIVINTNTDPYFLLGLTNEFANSEIKEESESQNPSGGGSNRSRK